MSNRINEVVVCDALDYLRGFEDGTVDAVITDPPYLTTDLAFDKTRIDWGILINECLRVIKPSGAVVMFAAMRTAVAMISAAPKYYRYDWVWHKTKPTGFVNAILQPLRIHEHILVWSTGATINGSQLNHTSSMLYYPVMREGDAQPSSRLKPMPNHYRGSTDAKKVIRNAGATDRYPSSILNFSNPNNHTEHPTQKPLDLMTYLVRTYTRPDELVLDPFAGSGSTLVAARNTGRRYAGCDLSEDYVNIARRRLAEPYTVAMFPDEPTATEPDAVQLGMFEGLE